MKVAAPGHVYVYYRVGAPAAAAQEKAAAFMAAVEAKTGIVGRLLARRDDPHTWMEVYAPVTGVAGFLRSLDALARQHGIADLALDGVRHVECFGPLPALAPSGDGTAAGRALR